MAFIINNTTRNRTELSQAVRDLRRAMGITQQEFAYRIPAAIRTVARWENNEPPRGRVLVRLAQMAEENGIQEIAGAFVRALQLQMTSHDAVSQPELKGWLDGLEIAFRHRHRLGERWTVVAEKIIEAVDFAMRAAYGISSPEGPGFERLAQQLRSRLEAYKPDD